MWRESIVVRGKVVKYLVSRRLLSKGMISFIQEILLSSRQGTREEVNREERRLHSASNCHRTSKHCGREAGLIGV